MEHPCNRCKQGRRNFPDPKALQKELNNLRYLSYQKRYFDKLVTIIIFEGRCLET